MKTPLAGAFMGAAIVGVMALTPPAIAKTAKECRAEWTANKAANQAKGITQKAYVAQCREADNAAEKPKAATANEKKEKASTTSSKTAAPAAGEKKTAKECRAEWSAHKAENQAKGITQKAYVADCRAGTVAAKPMAPATTTTSQPAQTKPSQSTMTPASEPAKPAPRKQAARPAASGPPGIGKPEGANQFAAEGQAKAHCPTGLVVWANLDSKIYHFSGHADYGHTKEGAYMCERDAMGQGMRAAKNEKHP